MKHSPYLTSFRAPWDKTSRRRQRAVTLTWRSCRIPEGTVQGTLRCSLLTVLQGPPKWCPLPGHRGLNLSQHTPTLGLAVRGALE